MDSSDLIQFINQIFAKKGVPQVKNLAQDFSDGSKSSPIDMMVFSPVREALQCPLRWESRLQAHQVTLDWREGPELEQDQCNHLLQLPTAAVLLGCTNNESTGKWQEPASYRDHD